MRPPAQPQVPEQERNRKLEQQNGQWIELIMDAPAPLTPPPLEVATSQAEMSCINVSDPPAWHDTGIQ